MDTETLNQDNPIINNETFRPVSILDRGGLDLNEDDLMYDQPVGDNPRGTLYMTGDFNHNDYSRTEKSRYELYESFANRNGSLMLEAGIMMGADNINDIQEYRRESMYSKKGSIVGRNKMSFLQGSIIEKKNGVNNLVNIDNKI